MKLLFGINHFRLMDEFGEGGGAAGGGESAPAATPASSAEPNAEPAKPAESGDTQESKPFLGGENPVDAKPAEPANHGEPKADAKQDGKPKEFTDEDYAKAIVKDEALLGDNKNVQIDADYVKAMAPAFKEAGLTPEQANKLANAFARVQMDSARDQLKARNEYFEKMKQESLRKYNESDWKQINAAIDANFKPGGTMNFVIRNSELGADPEFLAFLHKAGAAVRTDNVVGAGSGTGGGTGDANSFNGIASMW